MPGFISILSPLPVICSFLTVIVAVDLYLPSAVVTINFVFPSETPLITPFSSTVAIDVFSTLYISSGNFAVVGSATTDANTETDQIADENGTENPEGDGIENPEGDGIENPEGDVIENPEGDGTGNPEADVDGAENPTCNRGRRGD